MPTYDRTDTFKADYRRLSPDDRAAFKEAARKFVEDLEHLPHGQFRGSLRVKSVQGARGIFETWEGADGRATFQYGPEVTEGAPHIIWRRVGGHEILGSP